jgi:hypothetical protein
MVLLRQHSNFVCESTPEKSACKGSSFHERHGNQHIQRFLQDVQLIYGYQVEDGVRQVMYLTKCCKNTLNEGRCNAPPCARR